MPKGILVVASGPSEPSREDEYNDWYDNTHIPEVCAAPGFLAARRYKIHDSSAAGGDSSNPRYLAIYEIEGDDLSDAMKELAERSADGRIRMTDAMQLDPPPVVTLYEAVE